MIPDPSEKKVLIPIKIVNGKIEYLYGGALPELEDGIIGELLVPRYAILDNKVRELLDKEEVVELLPSGSSLRALVTIRNGISPEQKNYLVPAMKIQQTGWLVEVVLLEALRLKLRGTKKGELMDCKCRIPALSNREAISVNQAYTLISEKFEPSRKSHSGNVFTKVYCHDSKGEWQQLDELRGKAESKYVKENLIKQHSTNK